MNGNWFLGVLELGRGDWMDGWLLGRLLKGFLWVFCFVIVFRVWRLNFSLSGWYRFRGIVCILGEGCLVRMRCFLGGLLLRGVFVFLGSSFCSTYKRRPHRPGAKCTRARWALSSPKRSPHRPSFEGSNLVLEFRFDKIGVLDASGRHN